MAYNRRVYQKAKQILSNRKDRAERTQKQREKEVYTKIPQLISIDRKIAQAGANVIKAIGMKESDAKEYIDNLRMHNLAAQEYKKELLASAGYPKDYLDIHYTCPKCRDTGYVSGYMCDCFKKLLKETAIEQLNELSYCKDLTFEKFSLDYYPNELDSTTGVNVRMRMNEIYNFCKCYADDFDRDSMSIFMYGATGLGKTHLSLSIANEVVEKGYNVVYGSAQNLMTKLEKEHFNNQKNNEFAGSEQALLECDLLIIDDLGAEFSTQFTVAELYNIINTRMMTHLPTIISTNLMIDEIERKYTNRITSRIIGSYIALQFFGRDIRQIKKQNGE